MRHQPCKNGCRLRLWVESCIRLACTLEPPVKYDWMIVPDVWVDPSPGVTTRLVLKLFCGQSCFIYFARGLRRVYLLTCCLIFTFFIALIANHCYNLETNCFFSVVLQCLLLDCPLWNRLPAHLRQCDSSLGQFKRLLKTHLFGSWDRGALWHFC